MPTAQPSPRLKGGIVQRHWQPTIYSFHFFFQPFHSFLLLFLQFILNILKSCLPSRLAVLPCGLRVVSPVYVSPLCQAASHVPFRPQAKPRSPPGPGRRPWQTRSSRRAVSVFAECLVLGLGTPPKGDWPFTNEGVGRTVAERRASLCRRVLFVPTQC